LPRKRNCTQNRDGHGRGREILAQELGVSPSLISKARAVANNGSAEDIQAVKNNEISINGAYKKIQKARNDKEEGEKEPEAGTDDTIRSNAPDAGSEEVGIEEGDILDSAFETEEKGPEKEFTVTDAYGLPENVKFLKGAVILLIANQKLDSVQLLINHFLKKNERAGFYNLLPKDIKEKISEGELLSLDLN
jgi:hypothetical protein